MAVREPITNAMRDMLGSVKNFFVTDAYNYVFYFIILILLNVFASSYNLRFDLTDGGVYSLSDVSKRSVKNITEPLSVRVFFSEDLPAPYSNVRLYLKDILEEYKSAADGNFTFEFVDMSKDEGKNIARSYGIQPIEIRQLSGDEYKAKSAYMGMVFIHGDIIDKIPQVARLKGLEYMITTKITKMRGKVDVLSGSESVKVTLYVSDKLEMFNINGLNKLETAVKEVVDSASKENSGKVEFSSVSSVDDQTIEMLVSKFGATPLSWEDTRLPDGRRLAAGQGVITVTLEYGEKKSAINLQVAQTPFGMMLSGIEELDENVKSTIDSLISSNMVIGYVVTGATKNVQDEQAGGGALLNLLSDMYEIQMIDLAQGAIPETISTVIINGPVLPLVPAELYAIDNYIMRGGNVLFFTDMFYEIPQNRQQQQMQQPPQFRPIENGIPGLLETYGVKVNQDYVMDMQSFVMQQPGMDPVNLYFAPEIFRENLNKENPSTSYLNYMLMVKASSIELDKQKLESKNIKSEVLVSSSPESWLMTGEINLSPYGLEIPEKDTMKSYPLAVILDGKFESHFANGKPDDGETKESSSLMVEKHLKESISNSKIAVVSTSEITSGNLQNINNNDPRQMFVYNNALFLHNLVDYMSGFDDVPQMRSKGLESNLKEVSETSKNVFKIINIAALPLLSVIMVLVIIRLRMMRRKKIERRYAKEVK
ncbi:MAG: Gldg family protein [Spirochaetes bacterium]|nr:Gldg family protein [Spirochaetota bacterium]MBN2771630.1 Gldg family protein [Spirochaetota bacterium]